MCVAVQFKKFQRGTKDFGCLFRFCHTLLGRAIGPGLTAGADNEVHFAARASFLRDYTTTAEFNIVRVCAKDEHWRGFRFR